jgi:hypothetical protein
MPPASVSTATDTPTGSSYETTGTSRSQGMHQRKIHISGWKRRVLPMRLDQ